MPLEPVIGLEIHAHLLTASKIFCGCSTQFGAPPNTHVCPVCLGFPGALPVLNRRAVELGVQAALALGCAVHTRSIFARKNYFYPDLPKGYQISQYEEPLATGGLVAYRRDGRDLSVRIRRVHLEEDAGKSLHEGFPDSDRATYVDFNRSGVPLIEIVTEPDLRSAADAADFFGRLRTVLVAVRVTDGNMEEGSLRCDANVSVRPAGSDALGVKAELKNVNSFRFLQKALEYEIARQQEVVSGGGRVVQETRLWDAAAGRTQSMRSKEEAHDYRYFPEPDLPPVVIDQAWIDALRTRVPELPEARKTRLMAEYALPEYDAGWLTQSFAMADYFERAAKASGQPKAVSNWMMGELARLMNESGQAIDAVRIAPDALATLLRLVADGRVSGPAAKQVFERMFATGRAPEEIVASEGLASVQDEDVLAGAIARVLAEHADAVALYKGGKAATFGFLVGQVMRATSGTANPKRVGELLKRALDA